MKNKYPAPTAAILRDGISLDAVISAVTAKRAGTFRWIEIREGVSIPLKDAKLVITSVIPVRFGVDFEKTQMRRIENRIWEARNARDLEPIGEMLRQLKLREVLDSMSGPTRSLYTAKRVAAAHGHEMTPSVRATPVISTDKKYPWISYARNGSVQLTCLPAYQLDPNTGYCRTRYHRYYLVDGDTVSELVPHSAEERAALERAVQKARIDAGKTATPQNKQAFKPAINHIVGIY